MRLPTFYVFRIAQVLLVAIESAADSYHAARASDSDGGRRVTDEEWQKILSTAWEAVRHEIGRLMARYYRYSR